VTAPQLLAALPTGVCVAALVLAVFRLPRRLGPRVARYTVAARARMGDTGAELEALLPAPSGNVFRRVLEPMFRSIEDKVVGALGQRTEEATRLALEHAGIQDVTPREFRDQQFLFALFGLAVGAVSGLLFGPRAGVLLAVIGLPYGFLRKRYELTRRTRARQELMRAELWSVCPLLAVKAYASGNVQAVIKEFCSEAHGEVADELRRVVAVIEAGTPGEVALRAAAQRTAEPFAGRLYRTLADHIEKGGDMTKALLGQAGDIRNAYRDDRLRVATARTNAMVLPATIMAGTMVLLIGAPILSLLFNVSD
jgi:Flp pilus assembly protein TadB